MNAADPFQRTGASDSLAAAAAASAKPSGEWRTMLITLAGKRIFVNLDGQRVTPFDPESPRVPPAKQWHESKREPKRPEVGFFGLQTMIRAKSCGSRKPACPPCGAGREVNP
jgi:hypothetical protein